MINVKNMRKIEDYQVQELQEKKLFVNKYDLSLKYAYELQPKWKEFFFDIIAASFNSSYEGLAIETEDLFNYMYYNYESIIADYHLNIDIRDYIELTDYITLAKWENKRGKYILAADDIYLIRLNYLDK